MRLWVRLLFGTESRIEERNVVWNMLGSAVYALTSMLLGALVTRFLGADAGGIFFFSFSTFGQQMFIIAYFGMRPLQITDTSGRYSFADYRALRYYSCGAAAVVTLCYAALFTRSLTARTVLLLMSAYKILDGYADCCESEFQRQGRLYLAGKSNAFRTLLCVAIFFAVMLRTGSLLASCMASLIGQLAAVLLFCVIPLRRLDGVSFTRSRGSRARLFHAAKWLFLAAFLDLYVFAASKFAVNDLMSAAESGYYTTIFIPTSVINLMANFVIRPVLTQLSKAWEQGDRNGFFRPVKRILLLIAALTAAGLLAAAFLGIPALSLLVGPEAGRALSSYRGALLLVILGGGFYAALNLLYYVLVILRAQRVIFAIYGVCALSAWWLSRAFVLSCGINGAAAAYAIMMAALTALFSGAALWCVQRGEHGKQ
ncbi:hypothetical protein B6K86_07030 [Lachnospiraceae bacterium]|nr:hypothetical protein B6K86_07030 [Lachnospiraceae bacterium]